MASRSRRHVVALLVAAAVLTPLVIAPSAGAAKNRFGVVVVHDEGAPSQQCVKLSNAKIKALDLLNRTDFDLYTTAFPGFGRSVCYLDGEGHPPNEDCFDVREGEPNWGVWIKRKGKELKAPSKGVSSLTVPAGAVLYLQYAPFGGAPDFSQPQPDKVSLKSICSST